MGRFEKEILTRQENLARFQEWQYYEIESKNLGVFRPHDFDMGNAGRQ